MFRKEYTTEALKVEAKLEKENKRCLIWVFQAQNDRKYPDGFHAFIGARNDKYTDGKFGEHLKHSETLEGLLNK